MNVYISISILEILINNVYFTDNDFGVFLWDFLSSDKRENITRWGKLGEATETYSDTTN